MNIEEFIEQILSGIIVGISLKFIDYLSKEDPSENMQITEEDLQYLRKIVSIETSNCFTSKELKEKVSDPIIKMMNALENAKFD